MIQRPPLTVCFVWHMHQPDYKDQLTGRYLMPWVRLHAVKDYLDMVTLLADFPTIRQTFNLVPSLVEQIQDYSQPGCWDHHQAVTLQEAWTPEDKQFILERFFDAHPQRMIPRVQGYGELLERRNQTGTGPDALEAFSEAEFGDLTAMFHLCWFDPQWVEKDPTLAALCQQGGGFTLAQRTYILEAQRKLTAQILPTYRAFQESGQIEVTTTPFYHPILPLLLDTQSAQVGKPDIQLPRHRFQSEADARIHIEKALAHYQKTFGCRPAGIWPSEQAISPAVLKLFHEYGFQWTLSSEGNLARSLGIHWDRDDEGQYRNIQALAAPYEYAGVQLLFRHLTLSDLIGFTYAHQDPAMAAQDCYQRLKQIQWQMAHHPEVPHPVVTIALDGENCWEAYELDGIPFLRTLYQLLSDDPTLNVSRVRDYFAQTPAHAVQALPHLHTGSWINSDLHIWIGDPLKNAAWDLLTEARQVLAKATETQAHPPDMLEQAWEELYIAQGSDWFWWYGEPHHSGQDSLFDAQFRLHLQNIYTLLGLPVPALLNTPLAPTEALQKGKKPSGLIRPTIDGSYTTLDEWDGAGHLDLSHGDGAMHRGDRLVSSLYYGMDEAWAYLRLDLQRDLLKPGHRVVVYTYTPGKPRHNSPLRFKIPPGSARPLPVTQTYLYAYEIQILHLQGDTHTVSVAEALPDHLWGDRPDVQVSTALADVLELALPFDALGVGPGEALGFTLAVMDQDVLAEWPLQGELLEVTRPHPAPEPVAEPATSTTGQEAHPLPKAFYAESTVPERP